MTWSSKCRDSACRVKPSHVVMAAGLALALGLPNQASSQQGNGYVNRPSTIVCSSNDGRRAYCHADTRAGVRLVRQISGSPCQQGSTWGYDSNGVWVDRGCRAEFDTSDERAVSNPGTIVCSSNNGQQTHCNADTTGGVRLVRQISSAPCRQDSTWGYDSRGIWVDRNCRAEFELTGASSYEQARTIDAGSSILVRTNESIDVRNSDGRIFSGTVYRDVMDRNGMVVVPQGSPVELLVKSTSRRELLLDLDSLTVNGQRYAVSAYAATSDASGRDGIGKNARTGEFVGGGALLGTIIGAIAGGGKGAAIGAAAGAGAGAGAQVLTRGGRVRIPAESLLTFRLEQSLEMGVPDNGINRRGRHYHTPNR